MKKLLLLILLAPILIQAEELYLVCEGTDEGSNIFFDKGYKWDDAKFYIKATDKKIEVTDSYFQGMKGDTFKHFSYTKDKDFIKIDSVREYERYYSFNDYCIEQNYSLEINRMTGKINTEWSQKNSCGDKIDQHNSFKGICKKRKRAF
jgi:hypothetical protein